MINKTKTLSMVSLVLMYVITFICIELWCCCCHSRQRPTEGPGAQQMSAASHTKLCNMWKHSVCVWRPEQWREAGNEAVRVCELQPDHLCSRHRYTPNLCVCGCVCVRTNLWIPGVTTETVWAKWRPRLADNDSDPDTREPYCNHCCWLHRQSLQNNSAKKMSLHTAHLCCAHVWPAEPPTA